MKTFKYVIVICLFIIYDVTIASNKIDSASELSLNDFLKIVQENHPLAKQAQLLIKQAQAYKLQAKGNFDPVLFMDYNSKEFNSLEYYSQQQLGVKIPTYLGADFKVAFVNNQGYYQSPDEKTSESGVMQLGVSLPLLQGLMYDARRAALAHAKQMQSYNEAELKSILNKLYLKASKDYLEWMYAFYQYKFYFSGVKFAEERYKGIIERIRLGDEASIDSVEALIEIQNRIINRDNSLIALNNARGQVSFYLWTDSIPLDLPKNMIPPDLLSIKCNPLKDSLANYIDLLNSHPDMLKLSAKQKQSKIDYKLQKELLKPSLFVSGTYLSPNNNRLVNGPINQNYKLGVDVHQPLFFRKQIGKYQSAKYKVKEMDFELMSKMRELQTNLSNSFLEFNTYFGLYKIYEQSLYSNLILRDAEENKFVNGESSLFIINTREQKLIESQIKWVKISTEIVKSKLNFFYHAGDIFIEGI